MTLTKKVISSVKRYAQENNLEHKLERTLKRLEKLNEIMGEGSSSQLTQKRLAKLLFADTPKFVSVCCPDYSHSNGNYTFESLGSEVSLLAQSNISFGKKMHSFMKIDLTILYADVEAEDTFLLRKVNSSGDQMLEKIGESRLKTIPLLEENWECNLLTEHVPNYLESSREIEFNLIEKISTDKKFESSVKESAFFRSDMYDRIGVPGEMRVDRVLRTRAQYIALARWAKENDIIIINHSTVNLSAFKELEIGFIHNPAKIY